MKYELGHEGFPHIRWTQSHLLLEAPRKVDFIGRYENLAEDWEEVASTIGLKERLPHQNRSAREKGYRRYYDDQTRGLVEDFFKDDLKNFDYEF